MTDTRFRAFFVTLFTVGVAFLSLRLVGGHDSREVAHTAGSSRVEAGSPAAESAPSVAPASETAGRSGVMLRSGETLRIASGSLPAEGSVAVALQLGEPSANGEPLAGRILSEGRAPRDLSAEILGADRRTARAEIDAGWLSSPGRYIIEVRTTERTHFPLRRYALEVR